LIKKKKKFRPDWFTESEKILLDAIEKRNNAFKAHIKHPSESNQINLREARHHLLRIKRKAKRQWQFAYASKCKKADFVVKPKEAWDMVFKLMEGFQKHHHTYLPANFKKQKRY
jgi:predicted DNA binding CopG/RHH family protein